MISSLAFSQEERLYINLFENEKKIDSLTLIIISKENKTNREINLDKITLYQKDLDFSRNDYYVKTINHIILIPSINYIDDVIYLEIEFIDLKTKKIKQYIFNFGLGDITTVNYTRKSVRKLNRIIKNSISKF